MRGHGLGRLLVVIALLVPATAYARPYAPPPHKLFAGVTGTTDPSRFTRLTHKHPAVYEVFMTWGMRTRWMEHRDSPTRTRLGLHISTSYGYGRPGVISPGAIARGEGDGWLLRLNRSLALSRRIAYVRVMGEPNGHWNAYAAFAANGDLRDADHTPYWYRQAWRRIVTVLRGGARRGINRRLHGLGLPPLPRRTRAHLPRPRVAFLWVPQTAGSPDIPANEPSDFWPGSRYVDWVGTDFYAAYPNFSGLERFYRAYSGKPFVISEWGMSGQDDPWFVRTLLGWVDRHPRVRMLNYYLGFDDPGPYDLNRFPRSRAALRAELRKRRWLAYPPEFDPALHHPPYGKRHRKLEERPRPHHDAPPQQGAPPGPPAGIQIGPIKIPPLLPPRG